MIVNSTTKEVVTTTSNDQTMSANMTAAAFNAILEKLYSNPLAAVFRELTTNAVEAHMVANTNKKIKIQIPSQLFPEIVFRDYGIGLNDVEINKYLNCLFSTTKDKTDQFPGGFGLGSKSPLALVDSFNLTSYKDGIAYECIWYKKEGDLPVLSIVDTDETDEPNGLEIRVPLTSIVGNYSDFDGAILRTVRSQLFLFRDKIDLVKGFNTKDEVNVNEEFWNPDHIIVCKETDKYVTIKDMTSALSMYKGRSQAFRDFTLLISVGNVIYPLDTQLSAEVELKFKAHFQKLWPTNYIQLTIPIGNVLFLKIPISKLSIAPNRESISNTVDNAKLISDSLISIVAKYMEGLAAIQDKVTLTNFETILDEVEEYKEEHQRGFKINNSLDERFIKNILNLIKWSEFVENTFKTTHPGELVYKYFDYFSTNMKSNGCDTGLKNFFTSKSNSNLTIIQVPDLDYVRKTCFTWYLRDKDLRDSSTMIFDNSTYGSKFVNYLKANEKVLNFFKIEITYVSAAEIEKTHEDYKANLKANKIVRPITTFSGITLNSFLVNSNSITSSNAVNNVTKQYDKNGKSISFNSSYLTKKKVIVGIRGTSNNIFTRALTTTADDVRKELTNYDVVLTTDGIYSKTLDALQKDKSLTIYTDLNKLNFATKSIDDKDIYSRKDFILFVKYLLRYSLLDTIIHRGYSSNIFLIFIKPALLKVVKEYKATTDLELNFINNLIAICNQSFKELDFERLNKDSISQLKYPVSTGMTPSYKKVLDEIQKQLKLELATSEEWKNYISDFLRDEIFTMEIQELILKEHKLQKKRIRDLLI